MRNSHFLLYFQKMLCKKSGSFSLSNLWIIGNYLHFWITTFLENISSSPLKMLSYIYMYIYSRRTREHLRYLLNQNLFVEQLVNYLIVNNKLYCCRKKFSTSMHINKLRLHLLMVHNSIWILNSWLKSCLNSGEDIQDWNSSTSHWIKVQK